MSKNAVPVSIYRSMLKRCVENDPIIKKHIKTGLKTFAEITYPYYYYNYIVGNRYSTVHGPYYNETANLLSYTKFLIRKNPYSDDNLDDLFFAHKELDNFFFAKDELEKQDKITKEKNKQKEKEKKEKESDKTTTFGTSFF